MIRIFLNLYILVIIADVVLSFMPQFRFRPWAMKIKQLADFTTKPIRKYLPPDLGIDLSPIIVIILINLLKFFW